MRALLLVTPLVLALVGLVSAADQTILGKQMQVKDPKPGVDATKRTIVGQGLEKKSANTIVGDPTTAGATLSISARGTTPSSQTYPLPAALWTAVKGGFKYKDAKLTAGPVKAATIKLAKGTFQLQAVVAGKAGGISVVPPNLGTDGCVLVEIAGGDRYHLLFPAAADPDLPNPSIKKNNAKVFVMKNPTVEGACSGACAPGAPGCGWKVGDVVTFGQSAWGDIPNGTNAATRLSTNFATAYPLGALRAGRASGFSILFTSASAVLSFLPTAGPPNPLTTSLVDPINSPAGLFGGEAVALQLNVDFADRGLTGASFPTAFGDLLLCDLASPVAANGSSVRTFLANLNTLLSGGSAPFVIAEVMPIIGEINASFVGGEPSAFAHAHLFAGACP